MTSKEIQVLDKRFREFITEQMLQARIEELAASINRDYSGREVLFVAILNGAFIFASDLFRKIDVKARITFVKLASYSGTSSSGTINDLIGWNEDLRNESVIVIEDIVDTGQTLEHAVNNLIRRDAKDIRIASLFLKPAAYTKNIKIDYLGFEVPNEFIIGYGLDYNGYGRNLCSIYSIIQQ